MTLESAIFWRQTKALTLAGLKSRYRKTVAGFLWVVLNPMVTLGVQALVFSQFLKIDVDNYILFLIAGLVPWIFISQTLEMSTSIFVNSSQLMKSFSASPLVYLSAQVFDNIINFVAGFALALLLVWILTTGLTWKVVLLPLPIIVLSFGVFALAWLLATLQVFFRDTRFLITFALQLGFFLTPIFYPKAFVPEGLRWLVDINPLYHLIAPFQALIHGGNGAQFAYSLAAAAGTSALLWLLASLVWWRRRNMVFFYV